MMSSELGGLCDCKFLNLARWFLLLREALNSEMAWASLISGFSFAAKPTAEDKSFIGLMGQKSVFLFVTLASYSILGALLLVEPDDSKQKVASEGRVHKRKMGWGGRVEMSARLCGV
jgi:hypothetical protein